MLMKPLFERSEPVNYIWKDLVLTSPSGGKPEVDLSQTYGIEEGLAHFSKDLNFIQRLKLLKTVENSLELNYELYFKNLDQYFDDNLHGKILRKIDVWSPEFINWAESKDLNPKDFRVFLNEDAKTLNQLLDKVAQLKPSKMNGLQIIDLSLDLLAQEKITIEKACQFNEDKSLLSFLRKTRFTETLKSDEMIQSGLSKLNLSAKVKIKALRNGDQNQICLEVKSTSPEDLIVQLSRVSEKVDDIKKAWYGDQK